MPELPEVETVRRTMERALLGRKIAHIELGDDPILLQKKPSAPFHEALVGSMVTGIGRKGKYWWIETDRTPWVFGHLGMAGWIRELGIETIRLKEHGKMPLDDENGRPRFLRFMVTSDEGRRIAFTDGRRLGRLWLSNSPEEDSRVQKLGVDCLTEMPEAGAVSELLARRSAPIKAVLLDQAVFAGIGNWIADEVLYWARISPKRPANKLKTDEVEALTHQIREVVRLAVEVGADSAQFPDNWLFHYRWGGSKGSDQIDGREIVREPVGGRTTAWIPELQR